jgi:hypothetical protein
VQGVQILLLSWEYPLPFLNSSFKVAIPFLSIFLIICVKMKKMHHMIHLLCSQVFATLVLLSFLEQNIERIRLARKPSWF